MLAARQGVAPNAALHTEDEATEHERYDAPKNSRPCTVSLLPLHVHSITVILFISYCV